MIIPKIDKIHSKVLEAVKEGEMLDMDNWHSECGTMHCRAGWVVWLAGAEGKVLEEKTSTEFAAKMIYKASSEIKVPTTMFFVDNEKSMKDILRCAQEEQKTKTDV